MTNARAALADFGKGSETYCLTFGQFSLMDGIEAVLDKTGPAHVTVATWTADAADLSRSAEFLHDDRFLSLRFIVDTSFPQRQPGYARQLVELFGEDCIRTTRSHAKFVLIRNDEWDVVVRTSMNLNENPRLENFEVAEDAEFAGFLQQVVDQIFTEERPGDYRTKSRPALAGLEQVAPAASVRMGRGVSVGPR